MPDVRKEVAELICYASAVLDPNKWLAEEASDLATQIPDLDEIPPPAILTLAMLVAKGVSDAKMLALALDIEQTKLDDYLDALCEFGFAELMGASFKATPAGERAFDAVGHQMVDREMFALKARLEHLEMIRRNLVIT